MIERQDWHPERLVIRRMLLRDLDQVLRVEHRSFTAPWSRQAFIGELVENRLARYVVAEYDQRIAGYALLDDYGRRAHHQHRRRSRLSWFEVGRNIVEDPDVHLHRGGRPQDDT
ncbi:hypothetical protein GCM10025858_22020 [Alicyclobacillus sacchari]|nr:hypothetical protein GCM10025858_22020 [Alicyclobacillus sacchari]